MIENIEDAITLSMKEASMKSEIEAQERRLKWAWDMIEKQEQGAGRKAGRKAGQKAGRKAGRK